MTKLLPFVLAFMLFAGCSQLDNVDKTKVDIAKNIVEVMKDKGKLDASAFETYDKYKEIEAGINDIGSIADPEEKIPRLHLPPEKYDEIIKTAEKFTPLIGPYNQLVNDSQNFNENDADSVNAVYIDSAMLTFDAALIGTGAAYKIAYKTTGEVFGILDGLGVTKVCSGRCMSIVLSQVYWAIYPQVINGVEVGGDKLKEIIIQANLSVSQENLTKAT